MRFSIREMLALMFLVSLGMLAWRTSEDAIRDKARLAQLQAEIKSLEARLRLDQPALQQAIMREHEEFQPIHAMRERSVRHFDQLRQKYSTLEPPGGDVFSIRGIPSLKTDTGPAPVIFRMFVPEKRTIWLKFGVHMVKHSVHSTRTPDDVHDLLTVSPFKDSGPFEIQLPSGDQTLRIATGHAADGFLPLIMTLDDKVLLRTSFVAADVAGMGSSHISAPSQIDFDPQRDLPSLLTGHMSLRTPASGIEPVNTHAFWVWLSDRASNFARFPGE